VGARGPSGSLPFPPRHTSCCLIGTGAAYWAEDKNRHLET
jgi:hypothetical protein